MEVAVAGVAGGARACGRTGLFIGEWAPTLVAAPELRAHHGASLPHGARAHPGEPAASAASAPVIRNGPNGNTVSRLPRPRASRAMA